MAGRLRRRPEFQAVRGFSLVEALLSASLLTLVFGALLVLLPAGRVSLVRMGAIAMADALAGSALTQAQQGIPPPLGSSLISPDVSADHTTFSVEELLQRWDGTAWSTRPPAHTGTALQRLTVTVSWPDPVGQRVSGSPNRMTRTYTLLLTNLPR